MKTDNNMRKTIERLAAWLRETRRRRKQEARLRQERGLRAEAAEAVQVTEMGGEVFIALRGVPLVPVESLRWDLPTALEVARDAYAIHRRKQEEGARHGHR